MVLLKVNSEKQEVEVAPGGGVEGQHPGSREWSAQEQGARMPQVPLGLQSGEVPVFTDSRKTTGNNKLGLHVAIIWHNTIRHFFFFPLFKYKATCQHIKNWSSVTSLQITKEFLAKEQWII